MRASFVSESFFICGSTTPRTTRTFLLRLSLMSLATAALAGGCASTQEMLESGQTEAVKTAVMRAAFEMNCPAAEGTVLSREIMQPAAPEGWISDIQRLQYAVGVTGCGEGATYVVICPVGIAGCFVAEGGGAGQ